MSQATAFSLPPAGPSASARPKVAAPAFVQDLLVTAFGFATSSAVAYGCWYADRELNFSIYSFMVKIIIPLGAIICGMAAATGYWAGARLFNHRPSKSLLINIVLVSLTTYFGIHQLHYSMDKVQGVSVDKLMGFGDYLVAVTEHMSYGKGPALGKMGWAIAGLQVLGFSLGGFTVYGWLAGVPYCERCKKYLDEKQVQVRKTRDAGELHVFFEKTLKAIELNQTQSAIKAHADLSSAGSPKAMATMELRRCPCCPLRRFKLTVSELANGDWKETRNTEYFTEAPLYIS